jgi:hypothetical protein
MFDLHPGTSSRSVARSTWATSTAWLSPIASNAAQGLAPTARRCCRPGEEAARCGCSRQRGGEPAAPPGVAAGAASPRTSKVASIPRLGGISRSGRRCRASSRCRRGQDRARGRAEEAEETQHQDHRPRPRRPRQSEFAMRRDRMTMHGFMITNGGPHPADKWADVTTDMILNLVDVKEDSVSDAARDARAAKRDLRGKLFDIFNGHHEGVQAASAARCRRSRSTTRPHAHAQTPLDVTPHLGVMDEVNCGVCQDPVRRASRQARGAWRW